MRPRLVDSRPRAGDFPVGSFIPAAGHTALGPRSTIRGRDSTIRGPESTTRRLESTTRSLDSTIRDEVRPLRSGVWGYSRRRAAGKSVPRWRTMVCLPPPWFGGPCWQLSSDSGCILGLWESRLWLGLPAPQRTRPWPRFAMLQARQQFWQLGGGRTPVPLTPRETPPTDSVDLAVMLDEAIERGCHQPAPGSSEPGWAPATSAEAGPHVEVEPLQEHTTLTVNVFPESGWRD